MHKHTEVFKFIVSPFLTLSGQCPSSSGRYTGKLSNYIHGLILIEEEILNVPSNSPYSISELISENCIVCWQRACNSVDSLEK